MPRNVPFIVLIVSGVGPGDHLSELGIPVHRDLPVGHNLQDHYGTGALTFTLGQPVSLVQTRYENIPDILKYAIFGSGPLTVFAGVEVKITTKHNFLIPFILDTFNNLIILE